jgi:adenine C2-methylase RlmN of 23S rRNA A2503 and tRNA A37
MGQGEPLYNYRQVSAALRLAMEPEGLVRHNLRSPLPLPV